MLNHSFGHGHVDQMALVHVHTLDLAVVSDMDPVVVDTVNLDNRLVLAVQPVLDRLVDQMCLVLWIVLCRLVCQVYRAIKKQRF